MTSVLIVGCGNIGGKLYEEYKKLNPDRHDPAKGLFKSREAYDFAFIAVDTPMLADGSCDLSQIEKAISETEADVIIIRSTVPPRTTDKLKEKTGKHIVFSPEFYGMTQHCDENNFDFKFAILGGDKEDCNKVIQLLQEVYDARFRFRITDSVTAELTKYMANAMLASKVSLCVQFWKIANQFGVSYAELRDLWLMDKRFSPAHTFVYDEKPYWESHCFDKDLLAITKFADSPLIESVIAFNEECKKGK